MSEIEHKGPSFIMLMGLPGSGKSTWRAQFKGQCVQISTDDLVEDAAQWGGKTYSEVWPDEIKAATSAANAAFKAALKDGASIMWDQTNLTAKKRKKVLDQVPAHYHTVLVHVRCDEEVRQDRMKNRPGKEIPTHVDASMLSSMVPPSMDEGWDEILVVNT